MINNNHLETKLGKCTNSLVKIDSHTQCVKKVVSNRLGQVDFAIGLASEFCS